MDELQTQLSKAGHYDFRYARQMSKVRNGINTKILCSNSKYWGTMRRQTNWYVITGGPSSGKTTTINLLKERGGASQIFALIIQCQIAT